MNSTEKIRLVKKISAIIAIIAWVITIIFMAVKIYGWMQDPHLPAIHDQFVAIIGFITNFENVKSTLNIFVEYRNIYFKKISEIISI